MRNRRGVALVIVILGLLVVGAIISGVFVAAVLEHRTGQNARPMEQAFAAAEHGLTETMANWNVGAWNLLAAEESLPVSGASPAGTGTYAGSVRRLSNELFLVDLTGVSARGGARQRLAEFVKLRTPTMDIQAVLTTRGPSRIGGNAAIDGTDRQPAGWGACPPVDPPTAGIRIPNAGDLTFLGGCAGASCITGNPKVDADPTISDATFFTYGDADWAALTTLASKQLPGGNYQQIWPRLKADGTCDTAHPRNWGDPLTPSACGNYFPIIHVNGDLTVNTGIGQGLLLVDGDLEAQGGFEFYGIVIVRGRLRTAGTGNKFTGGLLAANVLLDNNSLTGNVELAYSSCAVLRAQQAAGVGAPLRSRGWMQVF